MRNHKDDPRWQAAKAQVTDEQLEGENPTEHLKRNVLGIVEKYRIEREYQLRERIAAEIEAAAARYVHGDRFAEVAARIARGDS